MHAAQCSFPQIPGWVPLSPLPREVGYMADGGVPSSVDGSLWGWLCAARVTSMCGEANVPIMQNQASNVICASNSWSASFPHLDGATAPNAFQPFPLYHTDALTCQAYPHTNWLIYSHTYLHPQPSIHPMLSKQIKSWSQKPSAHLGNRSQGERLISSLPGDWRGLIFFPVQVKNGDSSSATREPRSGKLFNLVCPSLLFSLMQLCFSSRIIQHTTVGWNPRWSVLTSHVLVLMGL